MYDRERAARLCETAGATDAAIQIRIDAGQLDRALRLALDAGDVDAAVRASRTRATADSTPIRTIPTVDSHTRTTIPIVPTIRILKMMTMTNRRVERRLDASKIRVVGSRRGAARGARLLVRW